MLGRGFYSRSESSYLPSWVPSGTGVDGQRNVFKLFAMVLHKHIIYKLSKPTQKHNYKTPSRKVGQFYYQCKAFRYVDPLLFYFKVINSSKRSFTLRESHIISADVYIIDTKTKIRLHFQYYKKTCFRYILEKNCHVIHFREIHIKYETGTNNVDLFDICSPKSPPQTNNPPLSTQCLA